MKEGEQMLQALFTNNIDCVTVEGLTQWDKGQELQITWAGMPSTFEVHFAFKGSKEALIVFPTFSNGNAVVSIPNELLQKPHDLRAYIYTIGTNKGETVKTIYLPMEKREKPIDYVAEVDPTVIDQIEAMLASILIQAENLNDSTANQIAGIKEDVANFDIAKTTETTLQNSKHGGLRLTKTLGNTVQNGTPTTSTPIPMLSKGECVEMIIGAYNTSSGLLSTDNKFVCNKYPIPCKKGDVFTVELDVEKDVFFLGYNNSSYVGYVKGDTGKSHTYTVTSDTLTHINFDVYIVDAVNSVDDVGKIVLKKNGKYVNFKKTVGENLVHFADSNGGQNGVTAKRENGVITTSGTPTITSGVIFTIEAKEVDLSLLTKGTTYYALGGLYLRIIDKNGNSTYDTWFTHNDNIATIRPYFQRHVNNFVNGGVYYPMLVANPNATWKPYQETVAWYYTNEPTRLGDVEFKDKDGLFKVQHTNMIKTFNGTESGWTASSALAGRYYIAITNIMENSGASSLCTHFAYKGSNSQEENAFFISTNKQFICNTSFETLDNFKAWLTENNVVLQVPLATPTIEVLDTESQIALNSLETFDGVTYVEDCSRVKPLETECEYGTDQGNAYALKALNNSESAMVKIEDAVTTMLLIGAQ